MMRRIKHLLAGVFLLPGTFLFHSCQTIKPYQRMYLNDSDMQMGVKGGRAFEQSAESIREGASGGGGKATGGCGCN